MSECDLFEPGFLRPHRPFFSGRHAEENLPPLIRSSPNVELSPARSTGGVFVVSVIAAISVFLATPVLGTGSREPSPLGAGLARVASSPDEANSMDRDRSWLAFLDALRAEAGGGSLEGHEVVRLFWKQLLTSTKGGVFPPTTAGRSDLGFVLAWDRAEHHLDVDLQDDGTFEWFYSNRRTDYCEGQEGLSRDQPLPGSFLQYLKYVS